MPRFQAQCEYHGVMAIVPITFTEKWDDVEIVLTDGRDAFHRVRDQTSGRSSDDKARFGKHKDRRPSTRGAAGGSVLQGNIGADGEIVLTIQPNLPQHCLYFLPLPQGHGSLRPTFGPERIGLAFSRAAA